MPAEPAEPAVPAVQAVHATLYACTKYCTVRERPLRWRSASAELTSATALRHCDASKSLAAVSSRNEPMRFTTACNAAPCSLAACDHRAKHTPDGDRDSEAQPPALRGTRTATFSPEVSSGT